MVPRRRLVPCVHSGDLGTAAPLPWSELHQPFGLAIGHASDTLAIALFVLTLAVSFLEHLEVLIEPFDGFVGEVVLRSQVGTQVGQAVGDLIEPGPGSVRPEPVLSEIPYPEQRGT